jgi:hypothetical protein
MNKIVTQRDAQDTHHARLIAQGMENAGADVLSITGHTHGAITVYCTHPAKLTVNEIDAEIRKVLDKSGPFYRLA